MKQILGWIIFIFLWTLISYFEIVSVYVLPTPLKVLDSFFALLNEDRLFSNIWFSIKINIMGYILSILFAIPVGFILGSFKTVRTLFSQIIDSMRFIPITALGGIFIALFGLTIWTKINFLAFSMWVFLVPTIVTRIDEVSLINLQMIKTLGASKWQVFKYVVWPYVTSRLTDDVRILVGISWTYIIVAELKNVQGGLGSLIFLGERQSNPGIVYCSIIIIVIIGALQDQFFKLIDKILFKYKYI